MSAKKSSSYSNAMNTVQEHGVVNKNAYEFKAKKASHSLMRDLGKTVLVGYGLSNTLNDHQIKVLNKKVEAWKEKERYYEYSQKFAAHGPNANTLGNVFSDSFSRNWIRYNMEYNMKKLEKRVKRQENAKKIGRLIGTALGTMRDQGRTLAMKSVVSDTKGDVGGISREEVTQTAAVIASDAADYGQIEF